MGDDAADRLRAVAEAVRALGMRVSVLRVGDITLQLAEPWGASVSAPAPKVTEEPPMTAHDRHMAHIKKQLRISLGHEPSDAEIRMMGPAVAPREAS